jgi:hypothetical protein
MYTLDPDEKTALVMVYTHNALIRGEAVVKGSVRISTWLRTDGAPEYIHLLKPQVLTIAAGAVKTQAFEEMYFPTSLAIGFHLVPPMHDPPDYDESEANRLMQPVALLVGSFIFRGKLRISTQTDIGSSIATSRVAWMSLYEVNVTNPALPQMGVMHVPMLVVRPLHVTFALEEQA